MSGSVLGVLNLAWNNKISFLMCTPSYLLWFDISPNQRQSYKSKSMKNPLGKVDKAVKTTAQTHASHCVAIADNWSMMLFNNIKAVV